MTKTTEAPVVGAFGMGVLLFFWWVRSLAMQTTNSGYADKTAIDILIEIRELCNQGIVMEVQVCLRFGAGKLLPMFKR